MIFPKARPEFYVLFPKQIIVEQNDGREGNDLFLGQETQKETGKSGEVINPAGSFTLAPGENSEAEEGQEIKKSAQQ